MRQKIIFTEHNSLRDIFLTEMQIKKEKKEKVKKESNCNKKEEIPKTKENNPKKTLYKRIKRNEKKK